jgi:hypothetical protein
MATNVLNGTGLKSMGRWKEEEAETENRDKENYKLEKNGADERRKNKVVRGETREERLKKTDEGGRGRIAKKGNAKRGKVSGERRRGRQTGELGEKREGGRKRERETGQMRGGTLAVRHTHTHTCCK